MQAAPRAPPASTLPHLGTSASPLAPHARDAHPRIYLDGQIWIMFGARTTLPVMLMGSVRCAQLPPRRAAALRSARRTPNAQQGSDRAAKIRAARPRPTDRPTIRRRAAGNRGRSGLPDRAARVSPPAERLCTAPAAWRDLDNVRSCSWPLHGERSMMVCCGAPRAAGSSYCQHHHRLGIRKAA